MAIRIDPLDQLASKIVRTRADGICEIGQEYKGYEKLMACHCFGRANKRVRYDLDNLVAGCYGHHSQMDADPEMKREVFIRKLGAKGYEKLRQRAYWPSKQKIDKKLIKIYLEKEWKLLNS
jgi:hypothetical protein